MAVDWPATATRATPEQVAPSVKSTVPAGAAADPVAVSVTVAVTRTSEESVGSGPTVTAVAVDAEVTVALTAVDAELRKVEDASP